MRLPIIAVLFIAACVPKVPDVPKASAPLTLADHEKACGPGTPLVDGVPGSPGHLIPSTVNPNGDSEMSALMRRMRDDLAASRDAIARGDAPASMLEAHAKVRCTWPGDPKVRKSPFDDMARSYLMAVEALDQAAPEGRRAAHDAVVGECVSCHQNTCPGPVSAIEKLRL